MAFGLVGRPYMRKKRLEKEEEGHGKLVIKMDRGNVAEAYGIACYIKRRILPLRLELGLLNRVP